MLRKKSIFLTLLFFSLFSAVFAQNESSDYLAKSGTAVNAVAWADSGEFFAASWNNTTILFDSETNTIAAIYSNSADDTINPFTDITSLEFSPDSTTLLSVHNNNTAMVHSIGDSSSALISGMGNELVDATFVGNSFKMIIPLDEQNLYEFTKSKETGDYDMQKRLDLNVKPLALTSNGADGKIFVTLNNGTALLVNTRNWEIIGDANTFTGSSLYPEFSLDGKHYFTVLDGNRVFISNITDPSEQYIIEEPEGFAYTARLSSDATKFVAATQAGFVKVYDIITGQPEFMFQLQDLDTARSIAVSPDGEFVLIGTQMGYIYRWSLHGLIFDKDEKKYANPDGTFPSKPMFDLANEDGRKDFLTFSLGFGTINNKNYTGSLNINTGYKNYNIYPFYFGGNFDTYIGMPIANFPYEYSVGDERVNPPCEYAFNFTGTLGYAYYFQKPDIQLFVEFNPGYNLRLMYNNSIKNAKKGKLFPGLITELKAGMNWKLLRLDMSIAYDSNTKFIFSINAGIIIHLKSTIKRIKALETYKESMQEENSDDFESSDKNNYTEEDNNI